MIWVRFHKFINSLLPGRKINAITDASGYSGKKQHWRDVDYGIRCYQNWIKTHLIIDDDSLLILSISLIKSNVHKSQIFEKLWNNIPKHHIKVRSLADSGYTSNQILSIVRESGAIPFHGIKKNAIFNPKPKNAYQKMVYFAKRFPLRFQKYYSKRNLVETVFGTKIHRKNL